MGFNTVVFICNDAMGAMEDDPAGFVDKVITGSMRCGNGPFDFGLGNHANGFQVVSCQHADMTTLIAAGGNYATPLGYAWLGREGHHTHDGQVRILRQLADKLGFRISKKPSK